MVLNTRELLPEPETPVNAVSRRFGISTLTSLRLFTRAPCTRIRSWLSAGCGAGDGVPGPVAVLIGTPSVERPSPQSRRRSAVYRTGVSVGVPRARPGNAGRCDTRGSHRRPGVTACPRGRPTLAEGALV